jgi:shikimate kinase
MDLLDAILASVDPRLKADCRQAFVRARQDPRPPPALPGRVVLVGHRAAGKSRMLPLIGKLLQRPTADLDAELERTSGRKLRDWVREDEPGFRAAERAFFQSRPLNEIDAAGGGFLSLHSDLLQGHTPVLIPVSFETYRERLIRDKKRPRLRPHLSIEEELRQVYHEREALHAKVPTWSLPDFLAVIARGGGR